jgi:hypothetical protein
MLVARRSVRMARPTIRLNSPVILTDQVGRARAYSALPWKRRMSIARRLLLIALLAAVALGLSACATIAHWAAPLCLVGSAVIMLLSFLAMSSLHHSISVRLWSIADVARLVAVRRNYALRAPGDLPAEYRVLVERLNELLAQMQKHESQMDFARQEVELKLAQRTEELRFAVQQAQAGDAQVSSMTQSAAAVAQQICNNDQEINQLVAQVNDLIDMVGRVQIRNQTPESSHDA